MEEKMEYREEIIYVLHKTTFFISPYTRESGVRQKYELHLRELPIAVFSPQICRVGDAPTV